MSSNGSIILIVVVIIIVVGLIYYQSQQQKKGLFGQNALNGSDRQYQRDIHDYSQQSPIYDDVELRQSRAKALAPEQRYESPVSRYDPDVERTGSRLRAESGQGHDPIKQQDLSDMRDPLTFPQQRLSREVLDKYAEYYEKTGTYPPFGEMGKPIFDTPILNGLLLKQTDPGEAFDNDSPATVPLMRLKSAKNSNRFYYYVIDQRYRSKFELKIPLEEVKINGVVYENGDQYGLPEIYNDDIIERISAFPNTRYKVLIYKNSHFP
jgi:hypothetical protein